MGGVYACVCVRQVESYVDYLHFHSAGVWQAGLSREDDSCFSAPHHPHGKTRDRSMVSCNCSSN